MLGLVSVISMLEDELNDIKIKMNEDYYNNRQVSEGRQLYALSLENEIVELRKKLNKSIGGI